MKYIPYIAIVLILASAGLHAESAAATPYPLPQGHVAVDSVRMEAEGDLVFIDIDLTLDNVRMKSNAGVDLVPVIAAPGRTLALPAVQLKGLGEYLNYEREMSLQSAGEREAYRPPYAVRKVNRPTTETIEYRQTLPYEPWMSESWVELRVDNCGCGITDVAAVVPVGSVGTETPPYEIVPHLAFVLPRAEEKRRQAEVECFLDFEVNKTDIRPTYMNNPRELGKIHGVIDELNANPNATVSRIDIIGYASPEGSLTTNKRLSEGRAMALRDYLEERYPFPRNIYTIVFGGENWDGLAKALETTRMEYKEEVLDIINTVSIEDDRETKIMRLRGGVPYRDMLRGIFPRLRVAVCRIDYSIRDFTPEEAREIVKTRPQDLSSGELFLLANTFGQGSDEFTDLLETAARIYPADEAANLNAAAAMLMNKNTEAGRRYLSRIRPESYPAEYNNAMGVLAMLQEDFDAAEKYLNAAAQSGLDAAKQNIDELKNATN